jgi:hypothetical protein
VQVDRADPLSNRILIIAKRAIEAGEVLSYNYYTVRSQATRRLYPKSDPELTQN